jgi:PadR family transcriptional regulator, regulatory protein PadR
MDRAAHAAHGGEEVPGPSGPPTSALGGAGEQAARGRFAEPFLLLLLAEGPSHGYDLMERLVQRGFAAGEVDPGYLYRTLRRMEEAGLVTSEWDSASRGPIKRTYALAPAGEAGLHGWATTLAAHAEALRRFLDAYGARFPNHASSTGGAGDAGRTGGAGRQQDA